MSRQRGYQFIDAAQVSTVVDVQSERQARELVPLLDAPEKVAQVYEEAVEEAGSPERVTARQLREKVVQTQPPRPQPTPVATDEVDAQIQEYMEAFKRLIPKWNRSFVDPHKPRACRKRVDTAEEIASWLQDEYVPAHAGKITPLSTAPRTVKGFG